MSSNPKIDNKPKKITSDFVDIFSLRNSSIWFLNIISKKNNVLGRHVIYGKNENTSNSYNLDLKTNIIEALPIDFSKAQQFVYEKSLEKIKFSIKYDLKNSDSPIKELKNDYSNFVYEIFINVKFNFKNIILLFRLLLMRLGCLRII